MDLNPSIAGIQVKRISLKSMVGCAVKITKEIIAEQIMPKVEIILNSVFGNKFPAKNNKIKEKNGMTISNNGFGTPYSVISRVLNKRS